MFKNVALGVIAGSLLAFAGTQVWFAFKYKKLLKEVFDFDDKIGFEDLDMPDVDWDALREDIGKLMEQE